MILLRTVLSSWTLSGSFACILSIFCHISWVASITHFGTSETFLTLLCAVGTCRPCASMHAMAVRDRRPARAFLSADMYTDMSTLTVLYDAGTPRAHGSIHALAVRDRLQASVHLVSLHSHPPCADQGQGIRKGYGWQRRSPAHPLLARQP